MNHECAHRGQSAAGAASGWGDIIFLRTKPMDRPDLPIIVPVSRNPDCSKVTNVENNSRPRVINIEQTVVLSKRNIITLGLCALFGGTHANHVDHVDRALHPLSKFGASSEPTGTHDCRSRMQADRETDRRGRIEGFRFGGQSRAKTRIGNAQ
jgi:hypothetical protein